ncbi:PepSY-associated TM helix domain-containing protein [Chondrinema litorale]|uniref:PepSY-associated TM helix domain-containing protein n=1 Tax=Chondrinema litorale TaxID=2994555 RepID=UPI002542F678|nr:PepSY-associated TM helix domain-containing protein [Chondrinema litorale]UZR98294.1 PepSY-associated TM helix domain-containing protein [Chondrinema litorale]
MKRKKGEKSKLRKIIDWLHLWPSLVSSLIVIFVCLTGTIIVFCDEIIDFANRDVLYVSEVKNERLPTEELLTKFRAAYPNRKAPGYMVSYKDPARSVKFNSYDLDKGLRLVYMNPYTGEIMKDDGTIYFFYITAHLHNSLLLGPVGEWIVDISTIIFVIGLITGIVLWWPKRWTKREMNNSFTVRWGAKFKRVNYDLHNVFGFYTLSISFVLAITGLIIAFKPFAAATVSMFGGDPSHAWEEQLPKNDSTMAIAPINPVLDRYYQKYPEVTAVQLGTYFMDKQGYYMLNASSFVGLKNYVGQAFFINKYTGEEINVPNKAMLHEDIENTWWMLHMGTWLGLLGKTITFITGIVATSLPVTGFIIWWGKRKKKPKKRNKKIANRGEKVEV